MQWSKEANAGFTTGTPWLQPNAGFITKNLDVSLGMGDLVVAVTALLSFYCFPCRGGGGLWLHTLMWETFICGVVTWLLP